MAKNLLKKGTRLIVYDVDVKRVGELANIGAEVAKSPAEVGEGSDKVIFTMLPNSSHVQSVFCDDNGIFKFVLWKELLEEILKIWESVYIIK